MKNTLIKAGIFITILGLAVGFSRTSLAEAPLTSNFTIGSTGPEVSALQSTLVSQGYLVMPVGVPLGYYGPLTDSAYIRYKAANSSVASPTLPAGCWPGYLFSATSGQPCSQGSSPVASDVSLSGDATISNFKVSDADEDISERGIKEKLAKVEFSVQEGDAKLQNVDLVLNGNGNDEIRPWRVFDKIYLLNSDGSVIASVDSSSKTDWTETDRDDIYRIALSNLSQIYKTNTDAVLYVAADIDEDVPGSDSGDADWSVESAANEGDKNGFEFINGSSKVIETGDTKKSEFSIQSNSEKGFRAVESQASPESDTLTAAINASVDHDIATFTLQADKDSKDDVKLKDFPLDLTINNAGQATYSNIIDNIDLYVYGRAYKGVYVANSCGAGKTSLASCINGDSAEFRFDGIVSSTLITPEHNLDVGINFKFKGQGLNQINYPNGITVVASSNVGSNDVEDNDTGKAITIFDGTATAEEFTISS